MAATAPIRAPKSNHEWRLLGKLGLGVSHDYASGVAEWAILRDHLLHYGLQRMEVACEIGCGAGRVAYAAAQHFHTVHALDVSEERLAQARAAIDSSRCIFHRVEAPLIPLPDSTCDLVYSIHVFQHFSSLSVVESYFREAHRVLRPGGVLMVHLPMIGAHGLSSEFWPVLRRGISAVVHHLYSGGLRLALRIGLEPAVEKLARLFLRLGTPRLAGAGSVYRVFSFEGVDSQLRRIGFDEMELRILPIREYHSYVFARRAWI